MPLKNHDCINDEKIEFFKRLIDGVESSNQAAENAMLDAYKYLNGGKREMVKAIDDLYQSYEAEITHNQYYMGEDDINNYADAKSILDKNSHLLKP